MQMTSGGARCQAGMERGGPLRESEMLICLNRHCERSEAIQEDRVELSNPVLLDCFVALLLAMTAQLGRKML